jgi:hypothetical protein
MRLKRMVAALLVALGIITATAVIIPTPAQAAACYGASCNGVDPDGRCNGEDSKTVGAMDIRGEGLLELRWSPSCVANWGRFTLYEQTQWGYMLSGITMHARVTVWNPDSPSYGTAHRATFLGGSSWSYMTDGRPKACTGVEIVHVYGSESGSLDFQSQGWTWGPCY